MNIIVQFYLRNFNPALKAFLTRILYSGKNIKIGKNFKCDSIPRILIDKGCQLVIDDNIEFRRNVEIRVHGSSKVHIENNVRVDRGVRILSANNAVISIKEKSRIGLYSVLNGGDSITVGNKSLISGFVYLQTSMHSYANKGVSVQDQGYLHKPILLKNDCWLGTHVVIMPGISLGEGSVIGSNSVVTKDVSSYKVMGGIPAKEIKSRE